MGSRRAGAAVALLEDAMSLQRREFLKLAAGVVALPAWSQSAAAQAYPTRSIRLLVGFPAGGGVDIVARLMAQWLSERLGQAVVVENKPGAATNLATEQALKFPPDGYTLLIGFVTQAVNASLYDKLDYNFIRDSAPIASISRGALVMVVNPDFPAKTIKEFIDYAKANPDMVNMGSGGVGSPPHVAGELFRFMTGIEMAHVPYRGDSPGLTDLMGGRIQVYFPGLASGVEFVKSGKLRALGVTTEERSKVLPDVPAVAEVVPGYEASTWYGIVAPKGTPADIIEKLNKEVNLGLSDPSVLARIAALGGVPMVITPAEFTKFIAAETAKWAEVVKTAGIKAN
jgi:tripartite-type tricarboxylate transporter receptor subunit TctC